MYFYKIFRLIIIAVIITYFIGCIWFFLSTNTTDVTIPRDENDNPRTFIEKWNLNEKDQFS